MGKSFSIMAVFGALVIVLSADNAFAAKLNGKQARQKVSDLYVQLTNTSLSPSSDAENQVMAEYYGKMKAMDHKDPQSLYLPRVEPAKLVHYMTVMLAAHQGKTDPLEILYAENSAAESMKFPKAKAQYLQALRDEAIQKIKDIRAAAPTSMPSPSPTLQSADSDQSAGQPADSGVAPPGGTMGETPVNSGSSSKTGTGSSSAFGGI